jgi:hypothetical protein
MTDYPAVLAHLYPDAQWSLNGDDYTGLTWLDDSPKPTQDELDAAWPAVQVARQNAEAAVNRGAAYAAEADPLFFYWQAGEGTEEAWLAKRAEIRDRYPYVEVDDAGA